MAKVLLNTKPLKYATKKLHAVLADVSNREIYKTLNERVKHEVAAHKSKLLEQKIK